MKFLITILILFNIAKAQVPTTASGIPRPQLVLLSSRPRCTPQRVLADIQCGCFYSFIQGVANPVVRERCRTVTGTPISQSQSACDPYLRNDSTYNEIQILGALQRVKNQCFKGQVTFVRGLSNFEILLRGEQLFILVNQLCAILGQPTVSNVPFIGRQVNGDLHDRVELLRQFNQL